MADIREDGSEIFHYDIPDFPVSIKKNYIPGDAILSDISIHWHEEIEITYLVSGSVKHQLNGKRVTISEGEAIFINSKQLHLIETNQEDCVLFCLIFNPTILSSCNLISKKYVEPIIENEKLDYFFLKENNEAHRKILDSIVRIHEMEEKPDFEIRVMKELYELWVSLFHILPKAEHNVSINEELHKVQKMLAVIQRQYSENIGLDEICNAGNVGKTKGTQLFCQYLNMTPVEYLINYRLEISSHLLKETREKVTNIAMRCGFSDSSYFAKTFKDRIGLSPLQYRKQFREIKEDEKNQ